MQLGISGGFIHLLQAVKKRGIAVLGCGSKSSVPQRRIDGGGIVKELIGDFARLVLEFGIAAMIDEQAEQLRAQLLSVGRIAGRGRTKFGVLGAKLRLTHAASSSRSAFVEATLSAMVTIFPAAAEKLARSGRT